MTMQENFLTGITSHIFQAAQMDKKNQACQSEQKLSCVAVKLFSRVGQVKLLSNHVKVVLLSDSLFLYKILPKTKIFFHSD